jgi:hypothetical protein
MEQIEAALARLSDDEPPGPTINEFRAALAQVPADRRLSSGIVLLAQAQLRWEVPAKELRAFMKDLVVDDPADLELLLRLPFGVGYGASTASYLGWVIPIAQRAVDSQMADVTTVIARVIELLDAAYHPTSALLRRRSQLVELAGVAPPMAEVLRGNDLWVTKVRAHLDGLEPQAVAEAVTLIAHLESVSAGPRPTKSWRKQTAAAVAELVDGPAFLRVLLDAVPGSSTPRAGRYGGDTVWDVLDEPSQIQIKGAVWAAIAVDESWVGDAVAARPRSRTGPSPRWASSRPNRPSSCWRGSRPRSGTSRSAPR